MNKYDAIGRLTADPVVTVTQGDNGMKVARYTLAIDRPKKRQSDEAAQNADFIPCVTFGNNAEFAEKYLRKGDKIGISGRLQSSNYTNKEGQKVFRLECIVTEHEFCQSKRAMDEQSGTSASDDGFMHVPDELDENLPFK